MVYIDVDNRERAKPRDKNQRRLIPLEETHETFKVVVRKWEMLVATKVKMSGSEKKKRTEQKHIQHFLHETCNMEVSGSFTL